MLFLEISDYYYYSFSTRMLGSKEFERAFELKDLRNRRANVKDPKGLMIGWCRN